MIWTENSAERFEFQLFKILGLKKDHALGSIIEVIWMEMAIKIETNSEIWAITHSP